jgi:cell division protein FtsL
MINLSKINDLSKNTKFYLINGLCVFIVLCSIMLMFFIQFKVDGLQTDVSEIDAKISALDDEIAVLEVEWVYLTRPERLRSLSEKYLQNNGYIASNQVKDTKNLQIYYTANLKRHENVAMNYSNQTVN